MTAWEKGGRALRETFRVLKIDRPEWLAESVLSELEHRKLTFSTAHASPDMLTRFHAHMAFLGKSSRVGLTYREIYENAVRAASATGDWPIKNVVRTVTIEGHEHVVDVPVPQSSKVATNKQLLAAYEYVQDLAKECEVILPENPNHVED